MRNSPFKELWEYIEMTVETHAPGCTTEKRQQLTEDLLQAVRKFFCGEHRSLFEALLPVVATASEEEMDTVQRTTIVRRLLIATNLAIAVAHDEIQMDLIAVARLG